ncbi:PD-(D/E)XK nuclease superfamily protein [Thermus arciformis]|uniref:PD-(D/E)XK nuclease superfamily protein n=1 Tax=Thermus arciformis TaxID=482827 RepID=A0A1G7HXQ1_9DEIN|nr:PD-(D/E)XK nuclease family protein [Thermus arciformis]SDF05280.1 PD-(D/E)XK nuclease superfamily protein [Thermus arciformis]
MRAEDPGLIHVTPNRAVARRLGVPYRTLAGLARELLRDGGLLVASPYRARRLLVQAVREALAPKDPQGLAAALEGPVRTLLLLAQASGQGEEALARLAKGASPRLARVARAARRYGELLRGRRLLDPVEVLPRAAALGKRLPLRLWHYPYLGTGELAFLKGVAAPGSEVELLLPEGAWGEANRRAKEALEEVGLKVRPLELAGLGRAFLQGRGLQGREADRVQALRFPDMEAEVRHVLASLKGLLREGLSPGEVALVARDDRRYGPLVAAVGFDQGLPVRLLYRVPVGESRVGSLAALLAQALQDFPYEATLRLLFHPLFPWERKVDLDQARLRRPSGEAWKGLGLPGELLELAQGKTGGELVQGLRRALSPLRKRLEGWPRERAALEALLEGLGELEEEDREGFFQGISELLYHLTVPAQPGYGGVELHTPLARYGGAFRHLFVLGMAEGLTPVPVAEDPFLGLSEVEELERFGLFPEKPWEAAAREALVFAALLGSLKEDGEAVLTYPEVVEGRPVPMSPFLERLGLEPRSPGRTLVGSLVEARRLGLWEGDPLQEAMERALEAEKARLEGEASSPHHGATGRPFLPASLSVSQLEDLATCSFRFYAKHLLRPRGDREAGDGDREDLGTFVHQVLARVFRTALEKDARRGEEVRALAAGGLLEEAFSRVEEEWKGRPNPPFFLRRPDWPHRRRRVPRLLARAFEDNKQFLRGDAKIVGVEEKVEVERGFRGLVPGYEGLKVRGLIDRVEERSGSRFYLDYKLGSTSPRVKDPRTGQLSADLQLPLYILLHGKGRGVGVYYLLASGKTETARLDRGALWIIFKKIRRTLKSGVFEPRPDAQAQACRSCPVGLLCRYEGR